MARQFVLIVEVDEGSANESVFASVPEVGAGMRLRAQEMPYGSTLVYQQSVTAPEGAEALVEGVSKPLSEWKPGMATRFMQSMRRMWNRIKRLLRGRG
jgi:hypothetical protein